jgi:hypothetical protein
MAANQFPPVEILINVSFAARPPPILYVCPWDHLFQELTRARLDMIDARREVVINTRQDHYNMHNINAIHISKETNRIPSYLPHTRTMLLHAVRVVKVCSTSR